MYIMLCYGRKVPHEVTLKACLDDTMFRDNVIFGGNLDSSRKI